MRAEINLLINMAKSTTDLRWEILIRNVIPTDYDKTVPGYTCLSGCEAFYPELKF